MALFYRFVASSMASSFETPETGKLTPYSAIFFFRYRCIFKQHNFQLTHHEKAI